MCIKVAFCLDPNHQRLRVSTPLRKYRPFMHIEIESFYDYTG
jgi:hypothetical protein